MKTKRLLTATLAGTFASLFSPSTALAQGSLTPPGAPAPMFKTLDQIEARKPIGTPNVVTTSTITITEPGSYVLVGPVTVASGNGITITSGNVTLDLNGFTISSTASPRAGSGVSVTDNTYREIVVRNGTIAGSGGLNEVTPVPDPVGFIHGVTIGITTNQFLSLNSSVQGVRVGAVTGYGIMAENVANCGVRVGLTAGIHARFVSQSTVHISNPVGIDASFGTVRDSTVRHANGTVGIVGTLVDSCSVYRSNSGVGIRAQLATHCLVQTTVAAQGIEAQSAVGSLVTTSSVIPAGAITNKYDMP